ncbi:MAG: SDR family oxidoreductase [Paracoccus sp. (in: a-proteobacteria)]|nr:SDR family oxidoreductase [Paracoccus sp. (in: a-proteobacteria)]
MDSTTRLDGKCAIITGAGRGIGRAAAIEMAQAGAWVIVNDVDADAIAEVTETIARAGGRAAPALAAIGTAEAADLCIEAALSSFGRMDIFCANAGILRDKVLWNVTDEDFDLVITTHLRGTFTCARAAATHFRSRDGGGRLILTSSIAGQLGNFGQTAYAAAKAGIAAMARTWSMELARAGVTVNAVVPNALTAMTATMPAFAKAAEDAQRGDALPKWLRQDAGMGMPDDVAPLFRFLASDRAEGITGQCIGIGGDKLSLWSHPAEIAVEMRGGGWTADDIAQIWPDAMAPYVQRVGIPMPEPR